MNYSELFNYHYESDLKLSIDNELTLKCWTKKLI